MLPPCRVASAIRGLPITIVEAPGGMRRMRAWSASTEISSDSAKAGAAARSSAVAAHSRKGRQSTADIGYSRTQLKTPAI